MSSRSIHALLARELTPSEITQVSGGDDWCPLPNREVSTEPQEYDTWNGWDTTPRTDYDGNWDVSCVGPG